MSSVTNLSLLFLGALLFMSCTRYQYATVSSQLQANENQEYVLENDTLQIRYSFTGYNGPVNIIIRNKLQEPLYLDWSRSALVLNDKSNTYWQNHSKMVASAEGYQLQGEGVAYTSTSIHGEIKGDKPADFIAPNAYVQISKFTVDSEFSRLPEPTKDNRVKINTPQGPYGALQYHFKPEDSPVRFRSYLTLSKDPSFSRPMVFESEFWVSQIVQMQASPSLYHNESVNKNQYYKSKATGFGTVVGVTFLVLLLGVVSAQ